MVWRRVRKSRIFTSIASPSPVGKVRRASHCAYEYASASDSGEQGG